MTEKLLLDMANAITELPIGVKAGGQLFYIYPPSFGTTILIEQVCKNAGIKEYNTDRLGVVGLIKLLQSQKELVATLLAICSFENRKQATIDEFVNERAEVLKKVNIKEVIGILVSILSVNEQLSRFCEESGINEENRLKKKVIDIKNKDRSSVSFGGRTLYGKIFSQVCEKYHWTLDYAIWGISFVNLNMMLIDAPSSIFLTEDEKKQVKIPNHISDCINADDPAMAGEIAKFLADA